MCSHANITLRGNEETGLKSAVCNVCHIALDRCIVNGQYEYFPVRVRCQCESEHPEGSTYLHFHGYDVAWFACQNFGTETVTSAYGTFTVCPPCAADLVQSGHYRRA